MITYKLSSVRWLHSCSQQNTVFMLGLILCYEKVKITIIIQFPRVNINDNYSVKAIKKLVVYIHMGAAI